MRRRWGGVKKEKKKKSGRVEIRGGDRAVSKLPAVMAYALSVSVMLSRYTLTVKGAFMIPAHSEHGSLRAPRTMSFGLTPQLLFEFQIFLNKTYA